FLLQEGLLYEPDVVIVLVFLGNDLIDSSWEIRGRPRRPTEPFWVLDDTGGLRRLDFTPPRPSEGLLDHPLLDHSMLWNVFKSSTLSKFTGRGGAEDIEEGWKERLMMPFSTRETAAMDRAWQTTIALLNRITDEDAQPGIRTLIVAAPAVFQVYDDDW